jgi:hypothetical protein
MHDIAQGSHLSMDELCDEIYGPGEKTKWTFYKELNPADPTARFPVERFVDFCRATKSLEAFHLMGSELGVRISRANTGTESVAPVALLQATTRLLTMEQDPNVSSVEMARATTAVIEEAEAILFRRFPPQRVAFCRRAGRGRGAVSWAVKLMQAVGMRKAG